MSNENKYQFKGTPGPWWLDLNETKVIANIPGYTSTWYVADCKIPERIMGGIETFKSKENAHLIAAAPDLLQACIKMKELIHSPNFLTADADAILSQAIHKALNITE